MLCERCLNSQICSYYDKISKLIREDIKLEVTECKYYRESPILTPTLTIQEKLRIVLNTLKEMEQKSVFVSKADLIKRLETKSIHKDEAEKLIEHLLKEGKIYEPKKDCLKIT